jgi:hypothetical protein
MYRSVRTGLLAFAVAAIATPASPAAALPNAALLAVPVAAVAQPLPAPEELFARHIREVGGAERLAAVKSRIVRGLVRNVTTGFVGRIVAQTAEPNLSHTFIEAPGITSWETVFDGRTGWTRTVAGVTTIQQGDELDDLRFNAYFHAELEAAKRFARLETVEQLNWNGRPAYRVRGTTAEGRIHDTVFDAETGLIIGLVSYRGPKPHITLVLSDYREFDGLKSPGTIIQRREGQEGEFVTTVTAVEFNKVDTAVFKADSDVERAIANGGRWPVRPASDLAEPPLTGPAANPPGPGQPR